MRLLRRLRHLPSWTARGYLLQALVELALARLALRLVSFDRLTRFFERTPGREIQGAEREQKRCAVQWAIAEAALYLPGETVCFPRAVAAQAMLRQRGIRTTLYYGAATLPSRKLKAHVWIQDGAVGVVGHESASEYHILARYPQQTTRS